MLIKSVLIITTILLLLVIFSAGRDPSAPKETVKTKAIVLIVITLVYVFFLRMRYRITDEGVIAIMPPLNYKVAYEDILDIYVDDVPWWMGWGLRIWKRRIGFISMHKPSVHIKKKKGFFRTIILSSQDPETFMKMVKEHLDH